MVNTDLQGNTVGSAYALMYKDSNEASINY